MVQRVQEWKAVGLFTFGIKLLAGASQHIAFINTKKIFPRIVKPFSANWQASVTKSLKNSSLSLGFECPWKRPTMKTNVLLLRFYYVVERSSRDSRTT